MTARDGAALAALVDLLGEGGVRASAEDLAFYGSDRCRGPWPVAPAAVALPRSEEEVQAVVRLCAARGFSIVPSGGRTGLAGGATATGGEVVLSLERLSKVLEVDAPGRTLRCQAGATVEQVIDAAAAVGLLYPVDFAAKGSAQIGGTLATNAGGVRVIRYGSTRSWVLGLRVVLADGAVVDVGRPVLKDNTGYDLRQLFVGSEGTLGVIVEATLRLTVPPAGAVVALCALPDLGAVLDLFARVQGDHLQIGAFECFDEGCLRHVRRHRGEAEGGPLAVPGPWYALVEVEVPWPGDAAREATVDRVVEVLAQAQDAGVVGDATVAMSGAQARQLWALREDISESLHPQGPHKSDVTVPLSKLPTFVPRWQQAVARAIPGAEARVFGHVGDGNLHLNVLPPPAAPRAEFLAACEALDDVTYAMVRDVAGSISAEHGVGLLKRRHLPFSRSARELAIMAAIKAALDPAGVFNPGKLLPEPGAVPEG